MFFVLLFSAVVHSWDRSLVRISKAAFGPVSVHVMRSSTLTCKQEFNKNDVLAVYGRQSNKTVI